LIQFSGKVVVVTGAAHGQGAAEVELLAELGARVVAADIDEAGARAVIEGLDASDALALRLDVADEDSWNALCTASLRAFGRIDALVNNAGIFRKLPLLDADLAQVRDLIAVNQMGCYFGHRTVGRVMRDAKGGSIVNVASVAALAPGEQSSIYGMTKAAVVNLTKGAALELAPAIRVNCVLPGGIDTAMLSPESHGFFQNIPLQRIGTTREMAKAVAFFASDASSYCTGATLVVDGGWTLPLTARSFAKLAQ
jgi:3alpha(or 20beta)-hydroxysteroid dehydrogenase